MSKEYETLASQHEYVDKNLRSTANIDYEQIRKEGLEFLQKKRNGETLEKNSFPLLRTKFNYLYESIDKCDSTRLDEFEGILNNILNRLINVQQGKETFTTVRNDIFEKELAQKYMRKK